MTSFTKLVLDHKGILFLNSEEREFVAVVKCHDLSRPQDSSNVRTRRVRRRGGGVEDEDEGSGRGGGGGEQNL